VREGAGLWSGTYLPAPVARSVWPCSGHQQGKGRRHHSGFKAFASPCPAPNNSKPLAPATLIPWALGLGPTETTGGCVGCPTASTGWIIPPAWEEMSCLWGNLLGGLLEERGSCFGLLSNPEVPEDGWGEAYPQPQEPAPVGAIQLEIFYASWPGILWFLNHLLLSYAFIFQDTPRKWMPQPCPGWGSAPAEGIRGTAGGITPRGPAGPWLSFLCKVCPDDEEEENQLSPDYSIKHSLWSLERSGSTKSGSQICCTQRLYWESC